MKRFLLAVALAVAAAPSASAAGCADNPKAFIKQAEQALKQKSAKLSKAEKQKADGAINRAKMANKFGNADGACKSLDGVGEILGIKS